jgi:hypothetical protein
VSVRKCVCCGKSCNCPWSVQYDFIAWIWYVPIRILIATGLVHLSVSSQLNMWVFLFICVFFFNLRVCWFLSVSAEFMIESSEYHFRKITDTLLWFGEKVPTFKRNLCWRWRYQFPLKCCYLTAKLYDIIFQKTVVFIFTIMRTPNLLHLQSCQCTYDRHETTVF